MEQRLTQRIRVPRDATALRYARPTGRVPGVRTSPTSRLTTRSSSHAPAQDADARAPPILTGSSGAAPLEDFSDGP